MQGSPRCVGWGRVSQMQWVVGVCWQYYSKHSVLCLVGLLWLAGFSPWCCVGLYESLSVLVTTIFL